MRSTKICCIIGKTSQRIPCQWDYASWNLWLDCIDSVIWTFHLKHRGHINTSLLSIETQKCIQTMLSNEINFNLVFLLLVFKDVHICGMGMICLFPFRYNPWLRLQDHGWNCTHFSFTDCWDHEFSNIDGVKILVMFFQSDWTKTDKHEQNVIYMAEIILNYSLSRKLGSNYFHNYFIVQVFSFFSFLNAKQSVPLFFVLHDNKLIISEFWLLVRKTSYLNTSPDWL